MDTTLKDGSKINGVDFETSLPFTVEVMVVLTRGFVGKFHCVT